MKIAGLRAILLSAPYGTADDAEVRLHLRSGFRSAALIQVLTDTGEYGLGETYAGVYAPEAVRALVEQFEEFVCGRDPGDIAALREDLRLGSYYWGRTGLPQSVIGGIEMALWDLKGKTLGVPVCDLLGAVHESIPAYASGGNDKPYEELAAEMREYLNLGFRHVKIRINNLPLPRIVEKISLCRETLGAGIGLAVDAAQGLARKPWTTKEALRVAAAIERYDILWLEEPAELTDYAGFAEVRRGTPIAVAGGETVTSVVEAECYLNAGSLDLFQPDAGLIGGISVLRQIAQLCERRSVPIAIHAWSGGVGLMGNYHAAFASGNCRYLELPTVPNALREELMVEPIRLHDGNVLRPTLPGLGVKLPADLESRYPYRADSWYRILGNRNVGSLRR